MREEAMTSGKWKLADDCLLFSSERIPDHSFAQNSEPTYGFLNRTTRPEFAAVRNRLEDWFSRYPPQSKGDLAARFKSDNKHHHAAHFELFLHELLLKLGCAVEIHPAEEGRPTKPDFRAISKDGTPFYVEAALVTGQSRRGESSEALMDQALDVFDRIQSPNFTLEVCWDQNPPTPLPSRSIANKVEQWLKTLDTAREFDRLREDGFRSLPSLKFPELKIGLEFRAIAKKPERRGLDRRAIGFWNPPGGWSGIHLDVRKRIEAKASKYGDLSSPYILALQIMAPGGDSESIVQALFGDEVAVFSSDRSKPVELRRKPNGAWTKRKSPAYPELSGILVFWNLRPWTKTEAHATLFHNPWAKWPYRGVFDCLPQARVVKGCLEFTEGEPFDRLLGL